LANPTQGSVTLTKIQSKSTNKQDQNIKTPLQNNNLLTATLGYLGIRTPICGFKAKVGV
jgi:hypothetical protein